MTTTSQTTAAEAGITAQEWADALAREAAHERATWEWLPGWGGTRAHLPATRLSREEARALWERLPLRSEATR